MCEKNEPPACSENESDDEEDDGDKSLVDEKKTFPVFNSFRQMCFSIVSR